MKTQITDFQPQKGRKKREKLRGRNFCVFLRVKKGSLRNDPFCPVHLILVDQIRLYIVKALLCGIKRIPWANVLFDYEPLTA